MTHEQATVLICAALAGAVLLFFIAGYLHHIRDRLIEIREILREMRNDRL